MRRASATPWKAVAASVVLHVAVLAAMALPPRALAPPSAMFAVELVLPAPEVVSPAAEFTPQPEPAPAQADPAPPPLALTLPPASIPAPPPPRRAAPRPAAPAGVAPASPATPGPSLAAPQPTSAQSLATWRAALAAWVEANKRYPNAARLRGLEGTVTIRFTVDPSGRVTEAAIAASAGAAILDEAVLRLLIGAQLPPFPPDMAQTARSETLRVAFALR